MSTTNAWMLGSAGVIGACGVAEALYQACAARRDAARYPAPGRMVDVGGHRLHLQVLGEARSGATVVLEAWPGLVLDELALGAEHSRIVTARGRLRSGGTGLERRRFAAAGCTPQRRGPAHRAPAPA